MLDEEHQSGELSELVRAAFGYLALALDKFIDYNSRISAWHGGREVMEHTFRDHAFVLKWSYAEMAPLIVGLGYDWAIEQAAKCIKEFVEETAIGQGDGERGGRAGMGHGNTVREAVISERSASVKIADNDGIVAC
ncbi:MAG: hypothetical protein IPL59_04335 [Candidatus Competibacteraceae bacterium]|uniref:Uncharacterized protein n=1 Tax=Candidatus Contendobacter odensis Run_B_J11 TaxID=1400861 RepID=A0A7U7GAT4_9GAMM|nr:hypothetical protein [Candidatus Contendobacter odensis]MBK8534410.1 hypothetical protein [Candidatus Competibacteraceae bacterium]MBK8751809.1 hypothetical protein [Candidatus Competibacteraceae bacterium]CDH44735.1 hypothetical protein BN874_1850035 [Candidatus Contendobacter odensis Run_B_J11]